jgi:hypothetical protein
VAVIHVMTTFVCGSVPCRVHVSLITLCYSTCANVFHVLPAVLLNKTARGHSATLLLLPHLYCILLQAAHLLPSP